MGPDAYWGKDGERKSREQSSSPNRHPATGEGEREDGAGRRKEKQATRFACCGHKTPEGGSLPSPGFARSPLSGRPWVPEPCPSSEARTESERWQRPPGLDLSLLPGVLSRASTWAPPDDSTCPPPKGLACRLSSIYLVVQRVRPVWHHLPPTCPKYRPWLSAFPLTLSRSVRRFPHWGTLVTWLSI